MAEIDNLSISISASAEDAVGAINKFANALGRFGGASKQAKTSAQEVSKGFEDVEKGAQKAETYTSSFADKISKLQTELSKTAPNFKGLASAASTIGKISLSPVTNSFKSLGNAAKSAYTSVTGLFSQIGRVAFYRLIRSAIKAITSGLSEGIKNLYHFSETFNGTFYQSMNRIATSANYLKNSLAAMVSPLINAVTPVLEVITDKIVDVFNLVNQFIARLTGQSTYTAAKKVATIWDDASKKTTDSTKKANEKASKSTKDTADGIADTVKKTAEEIQRYTLGFDELNILGKNKNGDTGDDGVSGKLASIIDPSDTTKTDSSKDKSSTDYGSMFETRKISGAVSDFADAIRKAFMAQDWESLGTLIGDKINAAINSVNWEGIGNKVGTALNGVIETAYYLLSTIDFMNIGSRIAEFLNGAIDSINFNTLGRLMVKKLTIIPDMIIGFFVGFDWGQAAAKLSDFVNGCFEEMTKWFKSYSWTDLGKIVAGKLIDAITNIQYYSIAKNFFFMMDAALEAASGMLAGFFDGLAAKFKAIVNWDSMSDDVKRAVTTVMGLAGIAVGAVGAILTFSGVNPALGIPMMIAGGFAAGTSASLKWDGLSDKMETVLKIVKSVVYPASFVIGCVLAFSGANIPLGLGMMITGAVGTYKTVAENWDEIYNKLRSPIGKVEALLGAALLTIGVLALVGHRYGLGIGLIMAGASSIGVYSVVNWDVIKDRLQGPLGVVEKLVSSFLLTLGVLALVGHKYGLGIGLIMAGAGGLGLYSVTNWGVMKDKLEGPLGVIEALIGDALLTLGILALIGHQYALGIGLIVAGAASLAPYAAYDWNMLMNKLKGPLGQLLAYLEGAKLVLGILCIIGGHPELGIGLVVSGAAGLGGLAALNWDAVYQFGVDAANQFKAGWDSVMNPGSADLSLPGNQGKVNKYIKNGGKLSFLDWLFPGANAEENGAQISVQVNAVPGQNFKRKAMPLEIDIPAAPKVEISVGLMKDNWTSVVEWAYQQGNVNYDQYVALKKYGWTFIDKWADQFKGSTLFQSISLMKVSWTTISAWASNFAGSIIKQAVALSKNGWSTVSNWVDNSKGGTIYQGISLFVNNWNNFLGTVSGVLHNWFPSIFADGGAIERGKVSRFAGGGIINAYSGGTSSAHGSLFLAGEAGPEIVGHVGGRTEVLNRSQLAATMYAAVNAAMAPAAANFANAAAYMYQGAGDYGDDDMDMLLQLVRAGSEATERQNELLRQQNDYLRQISTKELVTEISTADINRAQARSNRRAGTTIVPLSTQ